jgi:hypothetical protein
VTSDEKAELQAEFKAAKFEDAEQEEAALHQRTSLWNWLLVLIAVAALVSFARIIRRSISRTTSSLRNSGSPKKIDVEPIDVEANLERTPKPVKDEVMKQAVVSRTSTSSKTCEVKEAAISQSGWDEWEEEDGEWGEDWGAVSTSTGWTDNPFDDAGSPSWPSSCGSPGLSNAEAKTVDMCALGPQRGVKGKAD